MRSHNRDENIFVVAAWSDCTQGVRYLYDATSKTLNKLAEIAPWLHEGDLAEMKPITYQARDGLTIHGYLTLPKGGGKNLPLIVNPHGGPWARDAWGYNPEVQFLANRGYAVLQMNFRGSTGYGRAFWEAGFKQWGKKMQDDVTDGVGFAIAQDIADPKLAPASHEQSFPRKGGKGEAQLLAETRVAISLPNRSIRSKRASTRRRYSERPGSTPHQTP